MTYGVYLCKVCAHPGGQHLLSGGCHLCACVRYDPEDVQSWWSDEDTLKAQIDASYPKVLKEPT